jgi:hypothetical protein
VSCAAANLCLALPTGPADRLPRWGEAWDGSRWAAVPAPAVRTVAVDCTGTSCVAVGVGDGPTAAAARWDDATRTWSELPAPPGVVLTDVDCWDTDACVAVGIAGDTGVGVALRREAGAWVSVTGGRAPATALVEVACGGPTDCIFLSATSTVAVRAVERWDGSAWRTVPTDAPPSASLSCGGRPRACFVFGPPDAAAPPGSLPLQVLAEAGGRFVVDAGAPADLRGGWDSTALDCSPDGCLAKAGDAGARWNGTAWQPSASMAGVEVGFSCAAAAFCVAPPPRRDDLTAPPTFRHWNGGAWAPVTATAGPT